jgi:homoserine O-succinyltransferase
VPKHQLSEKAFGVYQQKILRPTSPYLNGFSDDFAIPISRWAEIRSADLAGHADLMLLAQSDQKGACIIEDKKGHRLYILDHLEYDSNSLADEYFRDVKADVPIKLPHNYFPENDPAQTPRNRWRSHGHLLISNWINEIYQTTPFEIESVGQAVLG